jgi:hypothetical protein
MGIEVDRGEIKVTDGHGNSFYFDIEELKKPEYGKPIKARWAMSAQDDAAAARDALAAAKAEADQYAMDHNLI